MGIMTMPEHFVPDEQALEMTETQASMLHCFTCGNDNAYQLREIEEPITVGPNTVLVKVRAAFCRFCNERVMDAPNNARLEQARTKLERGDVADFEPVGVTYRAS